jgi:mannitol/fructose-specific phosphotransferase system IIA component (Ntr-type)
LELRGGTKNEVLEELVERVTELHPEIHHEEALDAIMEREAKMSTGIINRVAVPHALCGSAGGAVGAIGISPQGIDFGALDGAPVQLVFLLLTNPGGYEESLDVLRRLACVLEDAECVDALLERRSPQALGEALGFYERRMALPLCS